MTIDVQRPRCPYCHDEVVPGEGRGCAECMGWTHDECWAEHGACPACGGAKSLAPEAAPPPAPADSPDRAEADKPLRASNLILAGLLFAVLAGTIATLVVSLVSE